MYLKKMFFLIFQPPRNMKLLKHQNTTISWRKMKTIKLCFKCTNSGYYISEIFQWKIKIPYGSKGY